MKKYSTILFFGVLIVICFAFMQCKKSSSGLNITLYDRDTPTIKNYIQGKWKLHYYYNGFCGILDACKVYADTNNLNYEFSNSQVTLTSQSTITVDTTYRFITYKANTAGYTHNIMEFYEGVAPIHFEVVKIKNDTLIIAQPFLYSPDFSEFFLTKIK